MPTTPVISFDDKFQNPSQPIYFHHIVDDAAGLLQVQVLGCNLHQTFHHDNHGHCGGGGSGGPTSTLAKKSTGFLAAVRSSGERLVLAWAESGHGISTSTSTSSTSAVRLRAGPHVLDDKAAAAAAIHLARILGVSFKSPFDRAGQYTFQASHVEVKLAAHAASLLLRLSCSHPSQQQQHHHHHHHHHHQQQTLLTADNLARLRRFRWAHGEALHFEIYVSRKNCGTCGFFVRRLQDITGIRFDLKPKQRLVAMEYAQQRVKAMAQQGPPPLLSTYEKDGVIHYVPVEAEQQQQQDQDKDKDKEKKKVKDKEKEKEKGRKSPIAKPVPGTPVLVAPGWENDNEDKVDESPTTATAAAAAVEDLMEIDCQEVPIPTRSPRPYVISSSTVKSAATATGSQ